MRKILTILLSVIGVLGMNGASFRYDFKTENLAAALATIAEQHPELHINFIYNELEAYNTSAKVNTDNTYEALRQIVGLNPVSIIKKGDRYFIEALQHGKFRYTGKIVNPEQEGVPGATVMLLSPKDSTVITFGVTDLEGGFSIPCDRSNVIGKISSLGYKPMIRPFTSFEMGTIKLTENPVTLKRMNVTADNTRLYADKSVYLPSGRQKNASTDAIDLLRNLAIPQLSLNPVDSKVCDLFGKEVRIFINGLEASQEELAGMRTGDVKKVEYLEYPDDPRFQGVDKAINFIMQTYEYGGYTKLSASETILNGYQNISSVFSKFTFRKWTYDIFFASDNLSSNHGGATTDATLVLKDKEGKDYLLNRIEDIEKSKNRTDKFPITFRASYNTDKIQIRNTIGFTHNNVRQDAQEGSLTYNPSMWTDLTYSRSNPSISNSIAYNGQLYLFLPSGFSLNFTPRFSYSHSNDYYCYSQNSRGDRIIRHARENAYYYRFDLNVSKQFNSNHTLSIGANGGDWINRLRYSGSDNYSESFHLGFLAALVKYTFSRQKFNLTSRLGVCTEPTSINSIHDSWTYPFAMVNFGYSPNIHHSFSAYMEFSYSSPAVQQKVPDVLRQNEFMYISGNPYLKGNPIAGCMLSYNWAPSNLLSLSLYGQFMGTFNRTLICYTPYDAGKALLRSYINDGDRYTPTVGTSLTWRVLEGSLQFNVNPRVTFFKSTGLYSKTLSPFTFSAQASYYLGKFFFQLYYQSPQKGLYTAIQGAYRIPNFHYLSLGWSDSRWQLKLTAANIFNKGWTVNSEDIKSSYYSSQGVEYGIDYHSKLNLTATYTFGYGKKVMQGNEVEGQGGASSAIIK